jgi:hypothetical protein
VHYEKAVADTGVFSRLVGDRRGMAGNVLRAGGVMAGGRAMNKRDTVVAAALEIKGYELVIACGAKLIVRSGKDGMGDHMPGVRGAPGRGGNVRLRQQAYQYRGLQGAAAGTCTAETALL